MKQRTVNWLAGRTTRVPVSSRLQFKQHHWSFNMSITLYSAAGSVGFAAHIVLEEINESSKLDYELVLLDMRNAEHRGEKYTSLNPKARVPSLVVDDTVLTETPAILVFLAQLAPESSVALPGDPLAFAQIQAVCSYLCSTVHVAHAHKYRGDRWVKDKAALAALTANVSNTMRECCEALEERYIAGPWVMGDDYTICDAYLLSISEWLEADGVNIDSFRKLKAHRVSMQKREAVKNARKQIQAVSDPVSGDSSPD